MSEASAEVQTLGDSTSESGAKRQCLQKERRICLVGNVGKDSATLEAAHKFGVPVVLSETGSEDDVTYEDVFVLDEFSGPIYEALHLADQRIVGPTALQQYADRGDSLPSNTRPLYSLAMLGLVICFTGFRKKDEVTRLMTLIHHMGGSIRKDVVTKVTHLIANCCGGDKYQYAVTFRVPVMSESWVRALWERRDDAAVMASNPDMMSHKLKPFFGARVCFFGFPPDERSHMTEVLEANGGLPAELEDPDCSHVVVDSCDTYSLLKSHVLPPPSPPPPPPPAPPDDDDPMDQSELDATFCCSTPVSSPPGAFKTPVDSLKSRRHRFSMRLFRSRLPLPPATPDTPLQRADNTTPPPAERTDGLTHALPVVDESRVDGAPSKAVRAPIVKAEWFWVSVQNEGCADEREYLFEDYLESLLSPSRRASHGTPASSRARKRKRLRDAVSRLTHHESPAVHKRRSSVSDAGLLSMSGSFLDPAGTPDNAATDEVEASEAPRSPRQQVFLELVQTETNYVAILQTIMSMFKATLEDMTEAEGPLLNNTELKIIFGNLPPIYEIHRQMLDELRAAAAHWKEEVAIGKILLKYTGDLVKAYPPFINFFENTKEMLVKCDLEKPRFHAFLKICQTRAECGRQSLQELLIRPVQRLPSISLLLNDILKHTAKANADYMYVEQALSGIKEVMTHINEDKRKTEGQLAMFDIYHEIDNCPADLLSSHRTFVARCEVTELSDALSGRGDQIVFFLFSDTMEVCKKRRTFNTMKSPTAASYKPSGKPYKHIRLLPLPNIKRVIDVRETCESRNVFALVCRSNQELKERTFSFTMTDDEADKLAFLRTLCRQMANAVCKADAETFLLSLDAHQLDINTSDVGDTALGKAFKFANKSRLKLGRAFSFNKTPSKLKRAVSTMMGSPFASTTNLTPSHQLAQMRLASCSNLHELGGTPKGEGTYVAPMSVQPTRKNKPGTQSLSMAALRRL